MAIARKQNQTKSFLCKFLSLRSWKLTADSLKLYNSLLCIYRCIIKMHYFTKFSLMQLRIEEKKKRLIKITIFILHVFYVSFLIGERIYSNGSKISTEGESESRFTLYHVRILSTVLIVTTGCKVPRNPKWYWELILLGSLQIIKENFCPKLFVL